MHKALTMTVAILVAVITTISLVPLPSDGGSGADPSVSIVENGNGVYELRSDYFEEAFGLYPNPSDIEDPVNGMVNVIPSEIATPYGSNGMMLYEPGDGGLSYEINSPVMFTDDKAGVTFAADLMGDSMDWTCTLYAYDRHVYMEASTNGFSTPREWMWDVGYLWDVDDIPVMGMGNLLVYTVGNFDGDRGEEIAVLSMSNICNVEILGLDDNGISQHIVHYIHTPGYTGFSPASLCAIDLDGDGVDEILVAFEIDNNTTLYAVEPNGDTYGNELGWILAEEVDGLTLNTVMVSLEAADVDGDGDEEVVVGGYLWDPNFTDADYTKEWGNRAGELFLGYYEADELNRLIEEGHYIGDMQGFTVLGDDDGTADNLFFGSSHFELQGGHHIQDTSIYSEVGDYPNLSRSPSWYNWTIPLEGIDLEGYADGLREQVFFNTFFYELNGDRFDVHSRISAFSDTTDYNRMMAVNIDSGVIRTQDPEEWDGSESLFISYVCDLDTANTEMGFAVFDYSGGPDAVKTEGDSLISEDVRLRYEWNEYRVPPNAFLLNADDDYYIAEYMAHMYTYTDPSVIAVVSGVPYDEDLAEVLISGPDSIGSTEYERSTESGSGTESSYELSAGAQGGLEALWLELGLGAGYTSEISESRTQTISFSTSYESAEDTVAMYVIPLDVYLYRVFESDGAGGVTTSLQPIVKYGEAVDVMMEYVEYVEFMETYNTMMSAMSEDYVPIPIADIGRHVQGDISTFLDTPSEPLGTVQVMYRGDGSSTSVSQCVELSEESEHAKGDGGFFNLDVQCHILCGMIGYTFDVDGMDTHSTFDASGMAFTSSLNQGMEIDYLGDPSEAGDVLGQYVMNGDFWAEMRSSHTDEGNRLDYVYVGYTVDSYTTAPELASLAADVYIPDGTDEDDPYNPTADSVFLRMDLPAVPDSRPERLADEYVLQFSWQGRWYDVNATTLGVSAEMETPDGWVVADSVSPDDGLDRAWFRVSGLAGLGYQAYEFRVVAESTTGVQERFNPSLPVTAYLDLRKLADNLVIVESASAGEGNVIIDGEHVLGDGSIALVVKTGLSEIGPVVVRALMENGSLETLADRVYLNSDGSAVVMVEAIPDDDVPEEGSGGSVLVLAAGVVVAMVITGLVARRD